MIDRYRVLLLTAGALTIPLFFLPVTPEDPFLVPKQVLLSFLACIAFVALLYPVENLIKDSSRNLLLSSLFFLICISVSIPSSINHHAGIDELKRWAYLIVLFFTATKINWGLKRLQMFLRISIIISSIIAIFAILEYFEIIPFYLYSFGQYGRIYSFFGNQNIMAQYLIITIFWGIGLSLTSAILKTKVIALICTILSVIALVLSFSRGAIISTISGGLFFSYLYLKTKDMNDFNKRKIKLILMLCITTLVAGVLLSNIISDGKTFRLIVNKFERVDTSRLMLWKETINTFYSNPFTGVGLGNYSLPHYIYVHNEVLQMVAETGIIGTGGFLVFLFFVFKHLLQQYARRCSIEVKILHLALISGCFATLMHSMVSFNLHSATSSFFFFVGLGILCANNSKVTKRETLSRNIIKRNIFILFFTVLLSFWAMQGEYKKIMGHYSFSQALLFQKQEDTSKSLGYSLKAIRYQPYNSKYHRFAGKLYLKTGQSKLAKSHFQKAKTLLP